MPLELPPITTPRHNESASATTIGALIGSAVSGALISQWPEYSELWVAVGGLVTALVGFGLKYYHAK